MKRRIYSIRAGDCLATMMSDNGSMIPAAGQIQQKNTRNLIGGVSIGGMVLKIA